MGYRLVGINQGASKLSVFRLAAASASVSSTVSKVFSKMNFVLHYCKKVDSRLIALGARFLTHIVLQHIQRAKVKAISSSLHPCTVFMTSLQGLVRVQKMNDVGASAER